MSGGRRGRCDGGEVGGGPARIRTLRPSRPDRDGLGRRSRRADPLPQLTRLVHTTTALQSAVLFRVVEKDDALAVFESLTPGYQAELIQNLREPEIADIVDGLDPDDRAELFGELPASVASRLMKGLDAEELEMTTAVLDYPKSAIGRYTSPEVLSLYEDWTAAEAIEVVRARIDGPETVYLLPVVGSGRVLLGVLSLRDLIAAADETIIGEMVRESITTHAQTDREEASVTWERSSGASCWSVRCSALC